ncbi:MAG: D-alanine--D-alanine ligase family protein [Sphaerochaetaceae bacterium]
MVVGLTYDLKEEYIAKGYTPSLVAEFDSIETIEAIEHALTQLGYEVERIGNIYNLVEALAQHKRWPIVFNIAEGLYTLGREAQVPSILDAYQIPYVFSDSLTLTLTLHKALAKKLVRSHNLPTADYHVIDNLNDIEDVQLHFPLFVKPMGGGTGMGIDRHSVVHSQKELTDRVVSLLHLFGPPLLVESYLGGREFTVGIIEKDNEPHVIGVMEILVDSASDGGIYSYHTKENYKESVIYKKVDSPHIHKECSRIAVGAWKALGCRDGGRVDLKMDTEEKLYFLEVNPLAGLHPIDSDLPILANMNGLDYTTLLEMIMNSAVSRLKT